MSLTFGLFETAADVCSSINDLIGAGFEPGSLSLLARDLESDTGEQADRRTTVAQVLNALDLTPASRLLTPTALVVIPEEGTYLAAGWPARELTRVTTEVRLGSTQLRGFLADFGYASEEAAFLDGRLQAGTFMLGVSDANEESLKTAREIFADQQAIHVGTARLPETTMWSWHAADVPQPDAHTGGDAVVLDISALAVISETNMAAEHGLIGHMLYDETGAQIGTIASIVVDPQLTDDRDPQYIVVQHGGFLGVGKHEYVIPMELIRPDTASGDYQAQFNLGVLENAPAFDPSFPISRREEQSICGYYGLIPYWDSSSVDPLTGEPAEPNERHSTAQQQMRT